MSQLARARLVAIDGTMAELFLSYEKEPALGVVGTNRKASHELVNEYRDVMLAGNWRTTHQGIAFKGFFDNDNAELVDGGHRLRAIREAAKIDPTITVTIMVTEGLTEEDMLVLDVGRRRTPGDFMRMSGEANANVLAAITRLCYLYENVPYGPETWRKSAVTPAMRRQYLAENPLLREAVAEGSRTVRLMAPTAAGSGWFLAGKVGHKPEIVNEFMDAFVAGDNLAKGSPILTLRELMINSRSTHRKWRSSDLLAIFIQAFNKWVTDTECRQLTFRSNQDFPKFVDPSAV
jgi:hypothetical protein